jgi:hypothetical protein
VVEKTMGIYMEAVDIHHKRGRRGGEKESVSS